VVVTDHLGDRRQLGIASEDLGALDRVDPHLLHLVLGEDRRLSQDVGRGGQGPDVVEGGGDPEHESRAVRQPEIAREPIGVLGHAGGMTGHVGVGAARDHRDRTHGT
jgi:hypothetical protein